jgi:hypothetical protein
MKFQLSQFEFHGVSQSMIHRVVIIEALRTALERSRLVVFVLYPGGKRYPIADDVEVVPVSELADASRWLVN